jgi:tetraacyldisaccharide 4'-kinase
MPFSWLYGAVVALRNRAYDYGWLRCYDWTAEPAICVGNLTVGGTGKTPHTEYLIRLLGREGLVGVLSRGYKRTTSGCIRLTSAMTADEAGDEPWQMKHKFPDVQVVVSADRNEGLHCLFDAEKELRPVAVILDDAFQHRRVRVGMNILLTDCRRLISDDVVLPAGRMREPFSGRRRAQLMVVTKCSPDLSRAAMEAIRKRLRPFPGQEVFFTCLRYDAPEAVFDASPLPSGQWPAHGKILLITGIANPGPLQQMLEERGAEVILMRFSDHHRFSPADVRAINRAFAQAGRDALAITTEKDAARLRYVEGLDELLRSRLYAIPLTIDFIDGQKEKFNKLITEYVRENRRNH